MTRQMAELVGVGRLPAAELGLAETIEDRKWFVVVAAAVDDLVAAAVDDAVDVSNDNSSGSCCYSSRVAPSRYHLSGVARLRPRSGGSTSAICQRSRA